MTQEQILIVDEIEEWWSKKGFIIDVFWSFTGYKCKIWKLQNDHDDVIDIPSSNWYGFQTKWDAYKVALNYLNKNFQ